MPLVNVLLAVVLVSARAKVFTGGFSSSSWTPLHHQEGSEQRQHERTFMKFHVTLNYRSAQEMEDELLAVST